MRTTRIFRIVLFLSFLNLFAASVAAQLPIPTPVNEMEERRQREREFRRLKNLQAAKYKTPVQREELKAKATSKDLEALNVKEEDKTKYANFLKQPRTGIFRLHDIGNCEESERVYNIEDPCPAHIIDKASAYSFQEQDYEFRLLADIFLEKSVLRVRKVETLSFLTNLGDVPLENLTLRENGIREMAEFVPSVDKKEVLAHYRIASRGFQVGKHVYKTSRPMKADSTYALRAITYRFDNSPVKVKRLDVIVAFRVVRSHEDGSITVLWKELQRQDAPKIMDKKFVAGYQPSTRN